MSTFSKATGIANNLNHPAGAIWQLALDGKLKPQGASSAVAGRERSAGATQDLSSSGYSSLSGERASFRSRRRGSGLLGSGYTLEEMK